MKIEVVRSARRRKSVEAKQIDGVLRLSIPAHMSVAEENHWIGEMARRFEQDNLKDLAPRASALARRYGLRKPTSIKWVDNQRTRWGSCTIQTGSVRVSRRVAAYPQWVIDYVIIHELAHLDIADHSSAFWALVNRYPKAERARGYLTAKGDSR